MSLLAVTIAVIFVVGVIDGCGLELEVDKQAGGFCKILIKAVASGMNLCLIHIQLVQIHHIVLVGLELRFL